MRGTLLQDLNIIPQKIRITKDPHSFMRKESDTKDIRIGEVYNFNNINIYYPDAYAYYKQDTILYEFYIEVDIKELYKAIENGDVEVI